MDEDKFIISGFERDAYAEAPLIVDFAKAKQLDRGGSTCDAYECTLQRRRVFVKRLKPEYRDNPLYRAAFDKEYDLGVSLSHPSLPRYVAYGSDYIVMDFIEGDTLADLIKRDDRRLKDKKFVRRLLSELIDVVEYLHNRNIVHCDIKSDNIILSPYNDRPATLIDLDKAYTSWLDNTSGDPAKYDCQGCGDGRIDFRGLGRIAEKLGIRQISGACDSEGVSADMLRKLLNGRSKVKWILTGSVAAIIIAGIVVMSVLLHNTPQEATTEFIAGDSALPSTTRFDLPESTTDTDIPLKTFPEQPSQTDTPQKPALIDNVWLTALINEKAVEVESYKRQMLDMLDCDTLSILEKKSKISDYLASSNRVMAIILHTAIERYGHLPESEVQKVIRSHPGWIKLEKEILELHTFAINWPGKSR